MISQKEVINMLAMQINGTTVEEIAKRYNRTKGTISTLLNREENQRLKQLMIDRIALAKADEIVEKGKEDAR